MTASARYHARRKAELHARLGASCASCGFDALYVGGLQVDHRLNNGNTARQERGNAGEVTFMLGLADSILHEYAQLLCGECHDAKTHHRV